MKSIYISIDVEPDLHTGNYKSLDAISKLAKLLEKYKIKATFFVTCDCLEKNPKIFQELKKQGHEISLHGYTHTRIDELGFSEKQENISKSIECFKKHLKIKPAGFRAPQHWIDNETIEILKKNDFKYDSTLIPWNFYHFLFFWKIKLNFFHNFISMKPHKRRGLLEIPISSFILPFSSVTLRFLPKPCLAIYLNLISSYKAPVFFIHSWDLIEIPKSKIYRLCPKHKFMQKFEYMLKFFSKKRKFLNLAELTQAN